MSETPTQTPIERGEMPKPYIKDFAGEKYEAIQAYSSDGQVKTFYYAGLVIEADLSTEAGRDLIASLLARFNLHFGCDTAIGPDISRWSEPETGRLIVDSDPRRLGVYTDTVLPYLMLQEERLGIPNYKQLKAQDRDGSYAREIARVKAVLPLANS